jgi:hypothetical protein
MKFLGNKTRAKLFTLLLIIIGSTNIVCHDGLEVIKLHVGHRGF